MVLMRKFAVLLACVLFLGAFAMAQMEMPPMVVPNSEVYFGYAFQHADTSGSNVPNINLVNVSSTNLNGFAVEFSHYFHGKLGYMINYSWGKNGAVNATGIQYVRNNFTAGPSYRLHGFSFVVPSVHVLAGVDHDNFTVPTTLPSTFHQTDTAFSALAGVAFDGNLSRHLAVRLGQVDYLYTRHYGVNQNSFRYTGGLVVRF
jgi:hypothetical protein